MTDDPARWRLPAPPDFRLAPTVFSHGAFQCPPFEWDGDASVRDEGARVCGEDFGARGGTAGALTRVLRLEEAGPRVVRISEREVKPSDRHDALPPEARRRLGLDRPQPDVELSIVTPGWTPDENARTEIDEAVIFMLGLDRDLAPFHDLCRDHRTLSRIPEIGAGRLLRCPRLWEELVKAICGTNVRWPQAVSMITAVAALGEEVDGRHAWPTADRVLEAGEEDLRERGRLGYRAPYVVDLARRIADGSLDPGPAEAGALDREELRRLFLSVRGIGPTTADHLLTLYGHPERLSVDAAVVAFLRDRHFGGRTPSEAEIRARYEPYGRWRALAYWFEFVQDAWWPAVGFEP